MKRGKNRLNNRKIETVIGQHITFTGELDFEGTILIEGCFEGNIRAHNGGTLIVGETGRITGDVDVPNLLLNGTIRGNVRASETLKMPATAQLIGDVEYYVLSISEGASIDGSCSHIDKKKSAPETAETNPSLKVNPKLVQPA